MVVLYRRHKKSCQYTSRKERRCRCPIYAEGSVNHERVKESLDLTSWEAAQQKVRQWESAGTLETQEHVTIPEALEKFIADCEARNLKPNTIAKYRRLAKGLEAYASRKSFAHIRDLTTDALRNLRATWHYHPRTVSKTLEKLRSFFKFCIENDWITKNPAQHIKAPEVRPNPTLPFTEKEVRDIIANTEFRPATFFHLLLHSGLRIIDAATLRPERIQEDKLLLYQQKTGQPVWVPLPPDLMADLGKLPLTGGFYFAVESDKPPSIAEYYRQKLAKAGESAGVPHAHPHRFRDTFAVNLLQAGVPLEEVSILLGHTDIKTTQQSYAPWVKARQDRLENLVRQTWRAKLVRVK